MELIHFSDKKIEEVKRENMNKEHNPFKPFGFWFSDESDYGWAQWCIDNDFGLDRLSYKHVVEIKEDANVLTLKSVDDIDDFTEKYQKEMSPGMGMMIIDWERVAEEYSGIIITPYQHERGSYHKNFWYYRWDCASGCIWDPKVIKKIELKNA